MTDERAPSLSRAVPDGMFVDAVGDVDSVNDGAGPVDLTHDSREVGPGWAFACVPGEHHDGHDFAAGAVAAGSTLLIAERRLPLDVAQLVVSDVRRAMGPIAAHVHGNPASKLRMIGVTGTNGKTTTTHLLGSILRAAGYSERELGTLSGSRTTPEAPDLQRMLAGYVTDGIDAVVMEVSSHALALHRVAGVRFDVAAFTNLGRDHLDLHESMEAYFRAKASLFDASLSDAGVTNLDDTYGRLLFDSAEIDMVGYSLDDAAELSVGVASHEFRWRDTLITVPIGGRFNVTNTLAALSVAERLGIAPDVAATGLASIAPVPGRFEVVSRPDGPFTVIVDYAHTPDGLVEVLTAVRAQLQSSGPGLHGRGTRPSGRVICVFGCGGDRDRDKRPLMGAAAASNADLVVVTSDNPRHEDPRAIIDAAVDGVDSRYRERVTIEVDRRNAIAAAIRVAREGDAIVIAGKGHESTQTVGDTTLPFDDREIARELLMSPQATRPATRHPTRPATREHSDDQARGDGPERGAGR